MNDQHTRRTLIPKLAPGAGTAVLSGFMALVAVALIAVGVGLIYFPAGVITAGLGLVALQWQFFGGQ
jgi:hypothetical protein